MSFVLFVVRIPSVSSVVETESGVRTSRWRGTWLRCAPPSPSSQRSPDKKDDRLASPETRPAARRPCTCPDGATHRGPGLTAGQPWDPRCPAEARSQPRNHHGRCLRSEPESIEHTKSGQARFTGPSKRRPVIGTFSSRHWRSLTLSWRLGLTWSDREVWFQHDTVDRDRSVQVGCSVVLVDDKDGVPSLHD